MLKGLLLYLNYWSSERALVKMKMSRLPRQTAKRQVAPSPAAPTRLKLIQAIQLLLAFRRPLLNQCQPTAPEENTPRHCCIEAFSKGKAATKSKRFSFNNFKHFLLSFQSTFHLSLTVLFRYRSPVAYLALGGVYHPF